VLEDSKAQSLKEKNEYIKKEDFEKIVEAVSLIVGAKNVEQFGNVML
jgi:hypothetical protein